MWAEDEARLGLKPITWRRCQRLAGDQATVLGAIGFHWAVRLER